MRNILLAIDGSECSKDAARLLSHFPHREPWRLLIVTVVRPPYLHHSIAQSDALRAAHEADLKKATETFHEVAALFEGADVEIEHQIRDGNLGQSIVKAADEAEVDLIVMGAQGHSSIARVLLGSVSDYVSTHAQCSVLVVRPIAEGSKRTAGPLRIVVGCDGSDTSTEAVREITEVQWGRGVDVHLLSIAPYLYDFFGELNINSNLIQKHESALEQAREQISKVAPHAESHLIESEHVGEGMVQFVEQKECDLAVVGETSRSMVGRFLMGSVSRYVLRHAPCSVWIARNPSLARRDAASQAESKVVSSGDGLG